MADRFIGADIGDSSPADLTVATSTTSKAVELRVTTGGAGTRVEVLKAIEAIKNYVQSTPTWTT